MLENTRFNPQETRNGGEFARELAAQADLYVNDAFGSAHRAHSSTEGVARLLPAYAGLLMERELEELGKLLGEVEHPYVVISGGAKVDDKLGVLKNLAPHADTVLIGGKMAEQVRESNPLDTPVELPVDVVAAAAFEPDAESRVVPYHEVPDGWLGLDIGPETRERFAAEIAKAKTVFWNGPMGVFEWPRFADGTRAVAQAVAARRRVHGRRRRRLGARADGARPRGPGLVGVDGRRRRARAARGQGPARRGRHPRRRVLTVPDTVKKRSQPWHFRGSRDG